MYGELNQRSEGWTLQFTRRLPHPPEKVWQALTEPEHLEAWFPTSIDGDRRAGAKLRFVFPGEGAPDMEGEMLAFDPPRVLEYRWGDDTLRFELRPDGDETVLVLVNTFDEMGKAAHDAAGWHSRLDILEHHLSGEPTPFAPNERWRQVHPGYVERFPPEASVIGPPDWHPESKKG